MDQSSTPTSNSNLYWLHSEVLLGRPTPKCYHEACGVLTGNPFVPDVVLTLATESLLRHTLIYSLPVPSPTWFSVIDKL